jgi:hypothetical protein
LPRSSPELEVVADRGGRGGPLRGRDPQERPEQPAGDEQRQGCQQPGPRPAPGERGHHPGKGGPACAVVVIGPAPALRDDGLADDGLADDGVLDDGFVGGLGDIRLTHLRFVDTVPGGRAEEPGDQAVDGPEIGREEVLGLNVRTDVRLGRHGRHGPRGGGHP